MDELNINFVEDRGSLLDLLIEDGFRPSPDIVTWHVAIGHIYPDFFHLTGSGVYLGNNIVITARHCIDDPAHQNRPIGIQLGSMDLRFSHTLSAEEITELQFGTIDIALVRVKDPTGYLDSCQPAAILEPKVLELLMSSVAKKRFGMIAGWGATGSSGSNVRLPFGLWAICMFPYEFSGNVYPSPCGSTDPHAYFSCKSSKGTGPCGGDSGGGFVIFDGNGKPYLAGVLAGFVDHNQQCHQNEKPSNFANVAKQKSAIEAYINQTSK